MNISKYRFEAFLLFSLAIYGFFYLTPSSYGYALELFGMGGEGLVFGQPRPIRSDEWAVWTPYIQSVVNNDFGRYNELSMYHEDFRGFNALPIYDWAMLFKPLMWPFLIFEPARAFSFHHGLIIVTFLIGWKQLFQYLLNDKPYASNRAFILFSLTLFYSSFSQVWWTTLGPLLAMSPWLLLALFCWKRNSLIYYFGFFYIATVWLLSHTYPPIIISVAYFGLFLLIVHQLAFFKDLKRLLFTSIACVGALAISYLYYAEIIQIVSDTVYPGQRVSLGGESSWRIWISAFIPYISHDNFSDIFNLNISEIGATSSLLPALALCFIRYENLVKVDYRVIFGLLTCITLFSLWMLAPLPELFGKISLFSMVPGRRLLFVLGLSANYLAFYLILAVGVSLTKFRCALFSLIVLFCWLSPSLYTEVALFKKSGWELLSILFIIFLYYSNSFHLIPKSRISLGVITISFLINFIYFFNFNPLQSAKPIFEVKDSAKVEELKLKQESDERGWLLEPGYPGALLSGVGLNSFTTVLIQPKLDFFRSIYPDMPSSEFNKIFNRYAHVNLHERYRTYNPQPDVIRIPIDRVKGVENFSLFHDLIQPAVESGGYIEDMHLQGNTLRVTGWMLSELPRLTVNFTFSRLLSYTNKNRDDVVNVYKDESLRRSGFTLYIELSNSAVTKIKKDGICLVSDSDIYGVRMLGFIDQQNGFACKY